jgi:hypothetical protein
VNRFALFPSEMAATAEAAVLLAAVTGFRDDAPLLGPLVLGLLVGPLDVLHLRQRSYLRMAYNSANRGLASIAASVVFGAVCDLAPSSSAAFWIAVCGAATAFVAVDSGLTIVLLRLVGEPRHAARGQVLATDALTLPIALLGAAAGQVAWAAGWWAAPLLLLPLVFIPEFVLAHKRWRGTALRNGALGAEAGILVVGAAVLAPTPDAPTVAMLCAIGVVAGLEFGVESRATVAPLLGIAVVAGLFLTNGHSPVFAAVLVAVIGTLSAWSWRGWCGTARVGMAIGVAALGGLFAAAAFGATRSPHLLSALLGLISFEVVAVVLSGPRRGPRTVVWTAPIGAIVVALGVANHGGTGSRLVILVVGASCVLMVIAWCAAPPWRSAVLGPRLSRSGRAGRSSLLLAIVVAAVICSMAALVAPTEGVRAALVWSTLAFAQLAVAVSLAAVRQWRFRTLRRRAEAAFLLVAAVTLIACYPPLAHARSYTSSALVGASLAVVAWIGVPQLRRADQVAQRSREGGQA